MARFGFGPAVFCEMVVRTVGFITLVHGRRKDQSRREFLGEPKRQGNAEEMPRRNMKRKHQEVGVLLLEVLRPS